MQEAAAKAAALSIYGFVGRGQVDYGLIATGNQNILIRCAEHHPADQLSMPELVDDWNI